MHVGDIVFYIPFRSRGVLKKATQSAPVLQRALSVTRHERAITVRIRFSTSVPQGAVAIPKWMWPSLCPLTAAESGEGAAAARAFSSPAAASAPSAVSSVAGVDHDRDAAGARSEGHSAQDKGSVLLPDKASVLFTLDGLRERTVRVTMGFSSSLPVATSMRLHCVSKCSMDPSIPAPNFTDLTNWLETFTFLSGAGVRLFFTLVLPATS